jgi:type I restriction enzyme S subunit
MNENEEIIGRLHPQAKLLPLNQCIDCIIDHRGKTPKKLGSDWVKDGIKVISAKNVHNGTLSNQEEIRFVTKEVYKKWMKEDVKKGDCLLSSEGATFGESLYWDFDFPIVLGQRIFCIRTNAQILDAKYFYGFMKTKHFLGQIAGRSSGTSVFGLRQSELIKVLVPIIPIEQQKEIGEVYYFLNKKIDFLYRNNITLEQLAEALFRQWFVEEADDSWEEVKLNGHIKTISGFSYRSADLNPSTTALVTLKSFDRTGGFKHDGFKEYTGKYKVEQIVSSGDLIVAHTDITQEAEVLGNPAIVIESEKYTTLIISTDIVKVIPTSYLSISYLYFLMRTDEFKHYCLGASNGTTVMHLSKGAIPKYEFKLPPLHRINKFTSVAEPLLSKMNSNQKHIVKLESLRDALLPKLMSGTVRVIN